MKNIIDYVRALNPVNERKDVVAALNQLQEELNEYTLPIAKEVQTAFADRTFKSPYMIEVTKQLRKRATFSGSALDVLVSSLELLNGNMDYLENEVARLFSFQFSKTNLTYRRVNFLRYIESAQFYVRYSRKLLLRVVAEEAIASGSATPMSWARAEMDYLDNALADFVGTFPAIAVPESKLKQTLAAVSDATVEEGTYEAALQSIGQRQLDPLQLAQFSPVSNWFFSFGKSLAEWKVKRFQLAKEEHQALQLRLQEYREIQASGKVTPKLQQAIQHTEQRIEQLDYQIVKIEEAHAYA